MSQVIVTETEVFTFLELSAKAQEKAIEVRAEQNGKYWDSDFTVSYWKEKLEALGFDSPKIQFSGFWSQGDGASFTSKYVDIRKVMKAAGLYKTYRSFYMMVPKLDAVGHVYSTSNHYSHENTIDFDLKEFYEEHAQAEDVVNDLTEYVKDLCREMYKELEADYDYEVSEKNVREYLTDSNDDYQYLESGELYS